MDRSEQKSRRGRIKILLKPPSFKTNIFNFLIFKFFLLLIGQMQLALASHWLEYF
jgi:hypothetical protein